MSTEKLPVELASLFSDETSKQQEITHEFVLQLSAWLMREDLEPITLHNLVELVGDLARVENNRNKMGESVLERMVYFVKNKADDLELIKWAARALGNLSYEHEEHINRIVELGAVHSLVSFLSVPVVEVKRNSCGALANLASRKEQHKRLVVQEGALPPLVKLLKDEENPQTLCMACRVITNVGDNEEVHEEMVKAGCLPSLIFLLKESEDDAVLDEALSALSTLLENVQNAETFLLEGGFDIALSVMSKCEDEDVTKAAAELLLTLATNEETKPLFNRPKYLQLLMEAAHSTNRLVQKASLNCISQLVLHDEIMVNFLQHLETFLNFLSSDDIDIQLNAAMTVGNLARNDEHCRQLAKRGALPPLIQLLSSQDGRVQHLATGAIRNLAILMENKKIMVEEGVLKPLIELLPSTIAHVKFTAILALNSLMRLVENRIKFVEAGGLAPLIEIKDAIIIDARDKQENSAEEKDLRIQLEAGRLLAILTAENGNIQEEIIEKGGLGLLKFLLESSFDILQLEGVQAVNYLSMNNEQHCKMIAESDIFELLLRLVTQAKSEKVQKVVLTTFITFTTYEHCQNILSHSGLKSLLQSIIAEQHISHECLEICKTLLNKL
ncbi:Vacuolar protein 8 [Balamuthia mandrillaris]